MRHYYTRIFPVFADGNTLQPLGVIIEEKCFVTVLKVRGKMMNAGAMINLKALNIKYEFVSALFLKATIPAVQVWVPVMSHQFPWALQV
jgi:hypothetical protein